MSRDTTRLAYSLTEAAQALSLSVRSLRYLLRQGKLGYVRLGRRVLIRHEDLERLLRQGYCRPQERIDADEPIRPQKQECPGARATPRHSCNSSIGSYPERSLNDNR